MQPWDERIFVVAGSTMEEKVVRDVLRNGGWQGRVVPITRVEQLHGMPIDPMVIMWGTWRQRPDLPEIERELHRLQVTRGMMPPEPVDPEEVNAAVTWLRCLPDELEAVS